jgi:hypothetical protein
VTGWQAVLDRYEAALDHHESLLRTGEPAEGDAPWPPPELPHGPLPPELQARAGALLSRGDDLARRLDAARGSLPPLPHGPRPPARPAAAPSSGRLDRSL